MARICIEYEQEVQESHRRPVNLLDALERGDHSNGEKVVICVFSPGISPLSSCPGWSKKLGVKSAATFSVTVIQVSFLLVVNEFYTMKLVSATIINLITIKKDITSDFLTCGALIFFLCWIFLWRQTVCPSCLYNATEKWRMSCGEANAKSSLSKSRFVYLVSCPRFP